uniref:Uncharacterized protein n=1 Tax=Anguilla anguilla TaxID=7936 RepID=A0A0E9RTW7_ANGAN
MKCLKDLRMRRSSPRGKRVNMGNPCVEQ